MIMATEKHQLGGDGQHDSDLRFFLDFDLEVLSWDRSGKSTALPIPLPTPKGLHLLLHDDDIAFFLFRL